MHSGGESKAFKIYKASFYHSVIRISMTNSITAGSAHFQMTKLTKHSEKSGSYLNT